MPPRRQKNKEQRLMQGEEGVVHLVTRPDGSKFVRKRYYSNVNRRTMQSREPILYAREGYARLFKLQELAHFLFPKNFIKIIGKRIPDKDPGEMHPKKKPPRPAPGKPRFPILHSEPVPDEGIHFRKRKEFHDAINAVPYSTDKSEEQQVALRVKEQHNSWVRQNHPEVLKKAEEIAEWGIASIHPEVNYTIVNGEVVFFEVDHEINSEKFQRKIKSLPEEKQARANEFLLEIQLLGMEAVASKATPAHDYNRYDISQFKDEIARFGMPNLEMRTINAVYDLALKLFEKKRITNRKLAQIGIRLHNLAKNLAEKYPASYPKQKAIEISRLAEALKKIARKK